MFYELVGILQNIFIGVVITHQSTEVVETLKNVSRLNLEMKFRFNKK